MNFYKDMFISNVMEVVSKLVICFYKFNFSLFEYFHSFIDFIIEIMNMIFRKRGKVLPKNGMFLVFDGDNKLLDFVCSAKPNKKSNNTSLSISCNNKFKDNLHTIKCWDYKRDMVYDNKLSIKDLLTHYFRFYKVYKKTKRDFLLKKDSVFVVLTDISKSTEMWNTDRFKMAKSIIEHDNIFYELIDLYNGIELRNEGDSFLAAFIDKEQCVKFAIDFYNRVSNIKFDNKSKLKVKVVVNYEKIFDKSSSDLICQNIKNTYEIISHSSPSKICVSDRVMNTPYDDIFCHHLCK